MIRLLLASLHLLALAIGFGAVVSRAGALREPVTDESLKRAFRADTAWGVAALLWIATGLWRYLGGTEKTTSYYNHNTFFLTKMALLGIVLILEIRPAITLVRWRIAIGRRVPPREVARPDQARRIVTISVIQAFILVPMLIYASSMARGYGVER